MEKEISKYDKQVYLRSKGWRELHNGYFIKLLGRSEPILSVDDAYLEAIKSELTSLPEKWCIKVTKENFQELFKLYLYDELISERETIGRYLYPSELSVKIAMSLFLYYGYTEITTEQFKKWVLKEDFAVNKADFLSGREPVSILTESSSTMKEIRKRFLINNGYTFSPNGNIELRKKSGGCIGFGSIDVAYEYAVRQSDEPKPLIVEFVEDKRKVIGWKFKKGFEKYERTCCEIINTVNNDTTHYSFTGYGGVDINKGILFKIGSGCEEDLREAGVLNIWFEPVFDEVKESDVIEKKKDKWQLAKEYQNEFLTKDLLGQPKDIKNETQVFRFICMKIAELQLKIEANDI